MPIRTGIAWTTRLMMYFVIGSPPCVDCADACHLVDTVAPAGRMSPMVAHHERFG
jgi:hypothetical protein